MAEGFCKRVYSDGAPGFFIGELAGRNGLVGDETPSALSPIPPTRQT